MSMIYRNIIFLFLMTAFAYRMDAISQDQYRTGSKLNVLEKKGIEMTEDISLTSSIVTSIPYGETVEVLDIPSIPLIEMGGIKGHRIKIQYSEFVGYVFDGYLSRLPAPSNSCKSLQEYAETKFQKKGKPKIYKSDERYDNPSGSTTQKYKGGITHISNWFWEGSGESLEIQNLSLEEGLLIGIACTGFIFNDSEIKIEVSENGEKRIEFSAGKPCGKTLHITESKIHFTSIAIGHESC